MSGPRTEWRELTAAQRALHTLQGRQRAEIRKEMTEEARDRTFRCPPCLVGAHRSCKKMFVVTVHDKGERTPTKKRCYCEH